MAILAPNSSCHLFCRDLWQRDHLAYPFNNGGVGCSFVQFNGGSFLLASGTRAREKKWSRGEVKVGAFWQDVLRPSSIEMESIGSVEDLEEKLRQAQEISQAVIIDWMATWCRKCIYLKPKLEKLAAEYHPRVKFYFVDVNKVPQTLVKRGNISKMPTIQLWKDGEWKDEVIGGHKAWLVLDEVREMIQKHI